MARLTTRAELKLIGVLVVSVACAEAQKVPVARSQHCSAVVHLRKADTGEALRYRVEDSDDRAHIRVHERAGRGDLRIWGAVAVAGDGGHHGQARVRDEGEEQEGEEEEERGGTMSAVRHL